MKQFAFMVHPLDHMDVVRKFPFTRPLPPGIIESTLRLLPPVVLTKMEGIQSMHNQTEGILLGCPLTAKQMLTLPLNKVINKIIQTGKLAEKMGARIIGLGAFTSVVGDGGITIAKNLNIPVTTGNSYTVATAIEGVRQAAQLLKYNLTDSNITIIGATGSIGSICTEIISRECRNIMIVANDQKRLERLANRILYETGTVVKVQTNLQKAIEWSDIVISATNSIEAIIQPQWIKRGAIICDVSRPRDVSKMVAESRPDVLVIEGGLVEVPGDLRMEFSLGLPHRVVYACMAETMLLALEGIFECFTLGRELTTNQVDKINRISKKHGFKVCALRGVDKMISNEQLDFIRKSKEISNENYA